MLSTMVSKSKQHIILLVDDEPDILDFLAYNLKREGYKVFTAIDGKEGIELVKEISPSLVLLDVMMPYIDGVEACQIIRDDPKIKQPIIAFLTSRAEDYSQIAGFKAGADDYITKPIRPRLLLSKVESLLRRFETPQKKYLPTELTIDRERYHVELKGHELQLPRKEFELLDFLASRPGKVYSRDEILSAVWGDETIVGERTVDVHIRKLREKLGNHYIRTVKGVGYTFSDN